MKLKVRTDTYTRIPNAAIDDPAISKQHLRVLTAICRLMNNDTCVATGVTYDYLVKKSESSKTTVTKVVKDLIERGYLVKSNKGGMKTANSYKVIFDVTYEVPEDSDTYTYAGYTMDKDMGPDRAKEVMGSDAEVTMTEVIGQKRSWDVKEAPIEAIKEEKPVIRKPVKRTLKKVEKTTTSSTTKPAEKKTTSKPTFTRGYENTTHTTIPSKDSPLVAWSGYDGTALAERDKTRGPLKGGKRVYTVYGQKFPMVMMEDGETVNMFASEVKTFSPTVMRYFKIPHYTEEQWVEIKKGAKRA